MARGQWSRRLSSGTNGNGNENDYYSVRKNPLFMDSVESELGFPIRGGFHKPGFLGFEILLGKDVKII